MATLAIAVRAGAVRAGDCPRNLPLLHDIPVSCAQHPADTSMAGSSRGRGRYGR